MHPSLIPERCRASVLAVSWVLCACASSTAQVTSDEASTAWFPPQHVLETSFEWQDGAIAPVVNNPPGGTDKIYVASVFAPPSLSSAATSPSSGIDSVFRETTSAGQGRPETAGGGSKTSGGDPTVEGRAQIIGNRHIGKLDVESHYDFDHVGFGWSTKDDEYTLSIRGMTQIDTRIYSPAGETFANSGIYNPPAAFISLATSASQSNMNSPFRTHIDTVALLDAYINFNYDPRLQFRIRTVQDAIHV